MYFKKIICSLSLVFLLFGCTDKTDERGFYIEGEKIGYHKETGTLYDKEGFDIKGWNKDKINKDTRLAYDKDGYNIDGFNRNGINKETKYTFNKNGLTKFLLEPKYHYTREIENINYVKFKDIYSYLENENESGEISYLSRSYLYDMPNFINSLRYYLDALDTIKLFRDVSGVPDSLRKDSIDKMKGFAKSDLERLEKALNKVYLDLNLIFDKNNKLNSYIDITFFTLKNLSNVKNIEIITGGKSLNVDFEKNIISTILDKNLVKKSEEKIYLNQIKVMLTDELFDALSSLEIDEEISVNILADNKMFKYIWKNTLTKKENDEIEGFSAILGKYYILKNK